MLIPFESVRRFNLSNLYL